MYKYKEVGKRILGMVMAVCLVMGLIPPVPVRAASIADATITLYSDAEMTQQVGDATYTYSGSQIRPYVKVMYEDKELTLFDGANGEYNYEYGENINAGTGSVTIMGCGQGFEGSKTVTFPIQRKRVSEIVASFGLSDGDGTYCFYSAEGGKPEITSVSIREMNNTVRQLDPSDYTISYYNNMAAYADADFQTGTPPYLEIALSPNSNYSTMANVAQRFYYRIFHDMSTVSVGGIQPMAYNGTAQAPSPTLTNTQGQSVSASDYTYNWTNNTNVGTARLTITGRGLYKGTLVKDYEIAAKNINDSDITIELNNVYEYQGGNRIPIENTIRVKIGDEIVPSSNYSVEDIVNGMLGTNHIAIVGRGNLTGRRSMDFYVKSSLASWSIEKTDYAYTGSDIRPELTVKDNNGADVPPGGYDVSYFADPEYTTPLGGAPREVGTYYVHITASGNSYMGELGTAQSPIVFHIVPRGFGEVKFYIDGDKQITSESEIGYYYNGSSYFSLLDGLRAQDGSKALVKGEDNDFSVKYYSDAACTNEIEAVASNFQNAGVYYLKIFGHGTYNRAEYVVSFSILAQPVKGSDVKIEVAKQPYTGSEVWPTADDVKVTVTQNGVGREVAASDYRVIHCQNNVNVGKATIIIQLTGNYRTTDAITISNRPYDSIVVGEFEIVPKKLSQCEKEFTEHVVYNGQIQRPRITIRDGAKALAEGQDYSVEIYSSENYVPNNKVDTIRNVGTYYVRVVGINDYANEDEDAAIKFTFNITKKPLTAAGITLSVADCEYTGSAVTPEIVVMDSGDRLTESRDYRVVGYYVDEACTNLSTRTSGRVYVKIEGMGNYDGEITGSFAIGDSLSDTVGSLRLVNGALEYNTLSRYNDLNSQIRLYDKSGQSVIDASYYSLHYYADSTYQNEITDPNHSLFVNAGTIYVRAEGVGAYYGTYSALCSIQPRNIEGMDAEVLGSYFYTGNAITLQIYDGVSQKGVRLSYMPPTGIHFMTADEYEIRENSYTDNRNAGTASVTLAGKGNYTGTKTITYTIQKRNVNDLNSLKLTIPEAIYTSRSLTPTVTLTYGDSGTVLAAGTDFNAEYYTNEACTASATAANLTNVGSIYVKITGTGNYEGVLSMDKVTGSNVFEIKPRDIAATVVDIEGLRYTYSAVPTESKIPVYTVRYEYTPGIYYELNERDFWCTQEQDGAKIGYKTGEQQIDFVGRGNFTGTKTITYYYLGNMDNEAAEITVDGINESYPYTSSANGITCPNIVVRTTAGRELSSSCYRVEYENNRTAGMATVRIVGNTANYWTGTYVKTFKITGNIADAVITVPDQIYTGEAYTADTLNELQVTCAGRTLTRGEDYKVTDIKNATNAALGSDGAKAPSITIQGIGEYFEGTATKTQTFSIKYDIRSEDLVVSEIADRIYNGNEIKPEVTVGYITNKVLGTISELTEGVDYRLDYRNNIEVASANGTRGPHVIVTALEDGLLTSGYVIAPFNITKVNIEEPEYGFHITGLEPQYMYTGREIRPAVAVEDLDGNILDEKNYNIVYSMNTPRPEAGTVVTVMAIGKGNYYGTVTASFQIIKRDISTDLDNVAASIEDQVYDGTQITPAFRVTFEDYDGKTQVLTEGVDYTIVGYHNNVNAAEAGVPSYGMYGYENGPYVQIKGIAGTSIEGTRNIPFTILPRDITTLYYEPVVDPVFETGQKKYDPEVVVKISRNSAEALQEGIDYQLTYANDTEVASANGTVGPNVVVEPATNNQNFIGSYMIEYSILPKNINAESIEVLLSDDDVMNKFDSEKLNYPNMGTYYPAVEVRDNLEDGFERLAPDTDYTIEYEDNDKVGTASVIVTARGNYTGQRIVNFTIGTLFDRDHVTVYSGNSSITEIPWTIYNGTSQVPADLSVRSNDTAELLEEEVDYTITYYLDEACRYAVLPENIVNAGTYYVSFNGLTSAGYIGSMVLPYTIRQKSLNASDVAPDDIPDQKFAGGNVRPAVTLRDSETGLVIPAAAYDVTYRDNNSIGAAYAIVTANENGNYTGQREVGFRIVEQEIDAATIYAIPDYNYTGEEIKPSPAIYFNGTRLQEGTDYVLTYGNNVYAGQAWIIIQGRGNYKSTKEISFNIRASLEDAVVSEVLNQAYTGEEVRPAVTVTCGGNRLIEGEDYTLSYSNNVEVGDAAVIITPSDSNPYYKGSKVIEFAICNSVAFATVTGVPSSQTYTGALILPEPQLYLGGRRLVRGRDYTVKWNNAVNVGTASVVITGIGEDSAEEGSALRVRSHTRGEYVGTRTILYRIIPKSIARCKVDNISDIPYDGTSHTPAVVVKDGNKILAEGTDYVVAYSGNKNIGTGFATIAGLGNYSGTTIQKFSIISADTTGLSASSLKATSVKLSWAKKDNVTGYQVYTQNSRKRIVQTTKNSVTIKNLKPGRSYTYKVRSYTVVGTKTYFGDFKTITFSTKPAKPVIRVTSPAEKTVKISWKKITGASGYEVYVAASKKGSYRKLAMILKGNVVSYTNKSLASGKTYFYKVRAYRTVNGKKIYSSYSGAKSIQVR